MELLAPISAVTVHPERARVTRRGRVEPGVGTTELVLADLPTSLLDDSVRVAGRSDAPVRVVGVDLRYRDLAEVPDDRVRAAERAVRDAEREIAGIDGQDAAEAAREQLLLRLARRSGDRLAAALAEGRAGAARVTEVGTAVAGQLVEVAERRRGHTERREQAQHALDAARAELDRLRGSGRQRREAVITVEADAEAELEVELSYVVVGAGWSSAYDARLAPKGQPTEQLSLTWYGMVRQATGEDWPECELTLSTARPAAAATLPELEPWWIDKFAPPPIVLAAAATDSAGPMAKRERAVAAAPAEAVLAQVVNGTVAASWRLARPTAVPGDGTPHRTTVTAFTLPARLDHVTAPALSPDAHLRATVTNGSGQVLLAGPVSTFLDDAFVGTTVLAQTAPGAEIELALGVDDRLVVERELVERTAHRARFPSTRGAVERWTITVDNRRPSVARVLVRDRLPVSRHADIKVVDVVLTPRPEERDELGRLEWTAEIAPGTSWTAQVRFGIEHPKQTSVAGWS
jgi:uncharacterized protein (TIGR02231 family)